MSVWFKAAALLTLIGLAFGLGYARSAGDLESAMWRAAQGSRIAATIDELASFSVLRMENPA